MGYARRLLRANYREGDAKIYSTVESPPLFLLTITRDHHMKTKAARTKPAAMSAERPLKISEAAACVLKHVGLMSRSGRMKESDMCDSVTELLVGYADLVGRTMPKVSRSLLCELVSAGLDDYKEDLGEMQARLLQA